MNNKSKTFFGLTVLAAVIILGCSGTTGPGGGDWTDIDFPNYREIVEEIAPPPYTAAIAKANAIDSMWTGTYLRKVFSLDEPMSLYSNLEIFQGEVDEIEQILSYNDSTGEYSVDSNSTQFVTIAELSSPTTFPTDIQAVMGTSIEVDYFITISYPNSTEGELNHVGFSITDTLHTLVIFNRINESAEITTTFCYWAKFDPVDSTIEMRGVTYKETTGVRSDRWAYIIQSDEEEEFGYRMGWYADPEGELTQTLFGTIIGGGDRNDEFALSTREYVPADSSDYFAEGALSDVFSIDGTAYVEGISLVTDAAFTEYMAEANYFEYADMPTALIASPFIQ